MRPRKRKCKANVSPDICFVCDASAEPGSPVIVESSTKHSRTPFAQCLSQVLGDEFYIVVSNTDVVSGTVFNLHTQKKILKLSQQLQTTALGLIFCVNDEINFIYLFTLNR